MGGDPPSFVLARLLFITPEFVVFHIQQLQELTVPESAEVVIPFILPHFQVMHTPPLSTNLVFIISSSW